MPSQSPAPTMQHYSPPFPAASLPLPLATHRAASIHPLLGFHIPIASRVSLNLPETVLQR